MLSPTAPTIAMPMLLAIVSQNGLRMNGRLISSRAISPSRTNSARVARSARSER